MSTPKSLPMEQTNGAEGAREDIANQKLVPQEHDSGSDTGSTAEKPVRQRLEKTTLAKSQTGADDEVESSRSSMDITEDTNTKDVLENASFNHVAEDTSPADIAEHTKINEPIQAKPALSGSDIRGRPTRKRSLEDLPSTDDTDAHDGPPTPSSRGHTRKRSRDVQLGDPVRSNGLGRSPGPTLKEEDEHEAGVEAGEYDEDDKMKSSDKNTEESPADIQAGKEGAGQTKCQERDTDEEQVVESVEMNTPSSDMGEAKSDVESPEPSPKEEAEVEDEAGVIEDSDDQMRSQEKEVQSTDSAEISSPSSDKGEVTSDVEPIQSPRRKRSRDNFDSELDRDGKVAATDEARARRSSEEARQEVSELGSKAIEQDVTEQEEETKSDVEPVRSPQRKRSRDDFDSELDRDGKVAATDEARARRSSEEARSENSKIEGKVTVAEQKDDKSNSSEAAESSDTSKLNAPKSSSGFSNASAVSPFGTLSPTKSPNKEASTEVPQASSSAFAASGFASMTGSASPFGTLGTKNLSPSKSPPPTSPPGKSPFGALVDAKKPAPFGGSASSSFASTPGTGKVFGGGFGGGGSFGSGQKLSSFAAPVGDTKLGSGTKEKPFGAKESSDDGESGSDDGSEGGAEAAEPEAEQTNQFHIQEVDTGEEGEDTVFTTRAKLFQYHSEKKAWTERGTGPFKLNVKRKREETEALAAEEEEQAPAAKKKKGGNEDENGAEAGAQSAPPKIEARFLMRTIATHKVILNAPIFKELKMSDQKGQEPKGKQMLFSVPINGKMVPYLLRVGKDEDIKTLYRTTRELLEQL